MGGPLYAVIPISSASVVITAVYQAFVSSRI